MTGNTTLSATVHRRLETNCIPLHRAGHYVSAAREAMTLVERAVKEKTGAIAFGTKLCKKTFGDERGIKLRVPFGPHMQKHAETLFLGAFSYYRNYVTHEIESIDEQCCVRIMVLASELLDLIDASPVSFTEIGGADGLVKEGIFSSTQEIVAILRFLDGQAGEDDTYDGLFEALAFGGFTDQQFQAVCDVGLVEFWTAPYEERDPAAFDPNRYSVWWYELTELAEQLLSKSA